MARFRGACLLVIFVVAEAMRKKATLGRMETDHALKRSDAKEIGVTLNNTGVASRDEAPTADFPAGLMAAGAVLETATSARTMDKYNAISVAVKDLVDVLPDTCDNERCPRGEFVGCVVRMAGHDFMDFNGADFGGSDGCIDFNDPDNGGLKPCLVGANGKALNFAFKKFSDQVSLADFLVIAAEALMHRQRGTLQPKINFASSFTWGRVTRTECPADGETQQHLPNPDDSCAANKITFVDNLGLTWRQTAALMGVHTLGRARKKASGFDGWWSDAKSQELFNNDYYISMTLKGWAPETVEGSNKKQWRRVGSSSKTDDHQMMLNTDMCLAFSATGQSDISAEKDGPCCAWIMPGAFKSSDDIKHAIDANAEKSMFCGFKVESETCSQGGNKCKDVAAVRHWCCTLGDHRETAKDCNNLKNPGGPAADDILEFASHEDIWLRVFLEAWQKATQVRQKATQASN